MGQYRARDLLLVPSLLSLLRLPLGLAFAETVEHPLLALAVLALAGVSDMLDGWYARKFDQATPTGAVVDGITDKLFVGMVVVSLVARQAFTWPQAGLLALREIAELPLVIWWTLHQGQRKARAEDPQANRVGKIATVLQFATVTAALFEAPLEQPLLLLTASFGVISAVVYWRRELGAMRQRSPTR